MKTMTWLKLKFAIGVGVHTGEVLMCHVGAPGEGELTVIGDSVNIASRLEGQTKELGWALVASKATVDGAGAGIVLGSSKTVQLRGRRDTTEAVEIIGIAGSGDTGAPVEIPHEMREALAANAEIAAGAAKAALGMTLHMITSDLRDSMGEKQQSVKGYRVISKIGQGGSSVVYLAERENDAQKVVLKILNTAPGKNETVLQRFVQEFDIISSIDHPNVVKIYDRGFSEHHAYLAMEYFPRGSLVKVIADGITGREALSLLAQAASAVREIHRHGILHRDLKPANLMVRADGNIALTDFGIAKRLGDLGRTRHGELYGTPYYVSPEQIMGNPATAQSDIYALGIIFHELLVGTRPFEAESVSELIALHVKAPRPMLPENLRAYQALLDRLLAVDPRKRFASADELIEGIDEVWTRQAVKTLQTR